MLDALTRDFDARHRSPDPVEVVHEYASAADREVAALFASALAYGNVRQIVASVRRALALLGPSPARAVAALSEHEALRRFAGFRHRFNSDVDVARLACMAGAALRGWGSLGALFMQGYDAAQRDIGPALERWASALLAADLPVLDRAERRRGGVSRIGYLLARPSGGSACKRQNLFLRWMVRPADGVDFGLWSGVSPSKLVVPLDTHVARIARWVGLSARRTADWKMAIEVTDALRRFDPEDPVRYDFALSRLGILRQCRGRADAERCRACALSGVCMSGKN